MQSLSSYQRYFHRNKTNDFTICMETQKNSNSQSNLEKEEWNWRNQPAWLQTILQSHSHQDSMVLAQRQKYGSMAVGTQDPSLSQEGDVFFTLDQIRSVAQSCQTLCDPINHSTPGFPVNHQLLEIAQTHVHRVGDAIQPSHPLLLLPSIFPISGSFPVSHFFTSGGQSTGASASASFLPMNIQD